MTEYGRQGVAKKAKTATCDVPGCEARITIVAERDGIPFTVEEYLMLEGWSLVWTQRQGWVADEDEATVICPEHGPVVSAESRKP